MEKGETGNHSPKKAAGSPVASDPVAALKLARVTANAEGNLELESKLQQAIDEVLAARVATNKAEQEKQPTWLKRQKLAAQAKALSTKIDKHRTLADVSMKKAGELSEELFEVHIKLQRLPPDPVPAPTVQSPCNKQAQVMMDLLDKVSKGQDMTLQAREYMSGFEQALHEPGDGESEPDEAMRGVTGSSPAGEVTAAGTPGAQGGGAEDGLANAPVADGEEDNMRDDLRRAYALGQDLAEAIAAGKKARSKPY